MSGAEGIIDNTCHVFQNGDEMRIPLTQGIAGQVARTGELLNIRDAQIHPLFYRNIDKETGFTTR